GNLQQTQVLPEAQVVDAVDGPAGVRGDHRPEYGQIEPITDQASDLPFDVPDQQESIRQITELFAQISRRDQADDPPLLVTYENDLVSNDLVDRPEQRHAGRQDLDIGVHAISDARSRLPNHV